MYDSSGSQPPCLKDEHPESSAKHSFKSTSAGAPSLSQFGVQIERSQVIRLQVYEIKNF